MEQVQKPDFVFRRKGRVHLNGWVCQFSGLLAAEVCASAFIVGSNTGYTMFRASETGTGYPLHSPVSPSLPPHASPCAIIFQLDSNMLSTLCPTILCRGKQAYGSILSTVFPTTVHPAVIILDKLKNFRKIYMSTVALVAIPPQQAKSEQTEIKLYA